MRRLCYSGPARQDLRDITAHIAAESGSRRLGFGFARQLRKQCARLADLPGTLGRPREDLGRDLRSFAVKGYVIYFVYGASQLTVVRVLEGHFNVGALPWEA